MEEDIQTRILTLEKQLEDVRKRARNSHMQKEDTSEKDSFSFSEDSQTNEKNSSSSFSSSSESAKIPSLPQGGSFYPMFYPQPDMRQQVEYLHFQLNQNSQVFMQHEKKWREDMQKAKEDLNKLKEENLALKETIKKIKARDDPALKEKLETTENSLKNLENENKKITEKNTELENENSKLKHLQNKQKKTEDSSKEESFKHEIKKLTEKIAFLENKVDSDKTVIDNLKKELSKSDDKIANLEDSLIENRNNFSQINKKLSIENDSLKKQLNVQTRSKEIKESDEMSKLKQQLYQRNKEIECLKAEKSVEEEQPDPVEIKVNKRKNIISSERLANLRKATRANAREENLQEELEDRTETLENHLIHLQIEKQRLENEYIKLPEFSRNLASKIRRAEVETELDSLTKTIQSVKTKLRSLNLI
jgi:chromosome segregation ATPase